MSQEPLVPETKTGDGPVVSPVPSHRSADSASSHTSLGNFSAAADVHHEFRAEVRQQSIDKGSNQPAGFSYTGNLCYRNAVVIMLLTSDVFMKYIAWYTEAVLQIPGMHNDLAVKSDPLVELSGLPDVYWTKNERRERRRAMEDFWKYVQSFDGLDAWPRDGPANSQQDAYGFLNWMFNNFRTQVQMAGVGEFVARLHEIVQVSHARRRRCVDCATEKSVRHRMRGAEGENFLVLDLHHSETASISNSLAKRSPLTIDGLLRNSVFRKVGPWRCEGCAQAWKAKQATLHDNALLETTRKHMENKVGEEWAYLRSLPEVMFMCFNRFDRDKHTKDSTEVEMVDEMDVSSVLEKTVPVEDRRHTRYKLRSIMSHSGGINSGHFCNYVRTTTNDGGDKWWRVDGVDVSPGGENDPDITMDDINQQQAASGWTPYLLCWERIVEDGPVIIANASKELSSPTDGHSLLGSDGSSLDLRPVSHEAIEGSRTNSHDSPAGCTNPGPDQVQEGGTISKPSQGILHAKVTIDGSDYRFKDLDMMLPPQFLSSMQRNRSLDVKIHVKLVTSNPRNASPRVVAYDLMHTQAKKPNEDGLKVLTQYSLTRQSKERMRMAAKRRWRYPKTHDELNAIWQKDGASLLEMDFDEFNKFVKTAEKAEKVEKARKKALANAVRRPDGDLEYSTTEDLDAVLVWLRTEAQRLNPNLAITSGTGSGTSTNRPPSPTTPKSQTHQAEKAAKAQAKAKQQQANPLTIPKHVAKPPLAEAASPTRLAPQPVTTQTPNPKTQTPPESPHQEQASTATDAPARNTRLQTARAQDAAAKTQAAGTATKAVPTRKSTRLMATRAGKAEFPTKATASRTTKAAPSTRKRKRGEDNADANELAATDTIEVAQAGPKKRKTATTPNANKKAASKATKPPTQASTKKAAQSAANEAKAPARKKSAPKKTPKPPTKPTMRTRSRKSPTPNDTILQPTSSDDPKATNSAILLSSGAPSDLSSRTSSDRHSVRELNSQEHEYVQNLIDQQQQSMHTRAPSASPTSSSDSLRSNPRKDQSLAPQTQQNVLPTITREAF